MRRSTWLRNAAFMRQRRIVSCARRSLLLYRRQAVWKLGASTPNDALGGAGSPKRLPVGTSERTRWLASHQQSGLGAMPFGNSKSESQRDPGTKPRVARNEPFAKRNIVPVVHFSPVKSRQKANNPNEFAARWRKFDTNPLGLKIPAA